MKQWSSYGVKQECEPTEIVRLAKKWKNNKPNQNSLVKGVNRGFEKTMGIEILVFTVFCIAHIIFFKAHPVFCSLQSAGNFIFCLSCPKNIWPWPAREPRQNMNCLVINHCGQTAINLHQKNTMITKTIILSEVMKSVDKVRY